MRFIDLLGKGNLPPGLRVRNSDYIAFCIVWWQDDYPDEEIVIYHKKDIELWQLAGSPLRRVPQHIYEFEIPIDVLAGTEVYGDINTIKRAFNELSFLMGVSSKNEELYDSTRIMEREKGVYKFDLDMALAFEFLEQLDQMDIDEDEKSELELISKDQIKNAENVKDRLSAYLDDIQVLDTTTKM